VIDLKFKIPMARNVAAGTIYLSEKMQEKKFEQSFLQDQSEFQIKTYRLR